ncbi:B-cell antigen receptor complex-associated protein beta chain [Sceloporus undulatus]|uniref:B-cell antigen receptor complex-associated protein beta chain n=1 Tax=Sceloporus undulatus TaxID=8520 RepID=UPI001C4B5DD1|nr:B-cell antigen receptor complex-associated protein beta chain [Sceloporus undulatus]
MVASLFQLYGLFWAILGLSVVAKGMDSTQRNRTYQKPDPVTYVRLKRVRFIAARRGAAISFSCFSDPLTNWYKETENGKQQELMNNSRIQMTRNDSVMIMQIRKLQHVDNGIYFCERNNSYRNGKMQSKRCGTELRVIGVSTFEQVQSRHTLKDAIIVIQTILLVLFLSMPLFLTTGKGESKKASAEDHTYEGLTVELADTYEDITIYQDTAQKWDLGEHPCEE